MDKSEMDRLVNAVTERMMQRLGEQAPGERKRILVLGKDPACPIAACLRREFAADIGTIESLPGHDFVVMPAWYVEKLRGGTPQLPKGEMPPGGVLDCTGQRLLHERGLRERCTAGIRTVHLGAHTIVTSLASDFIKQRGLALTREK